MIILRILLKCCIESALRLLGAYEEITREKEKEKKKEKKSFPTVEYDMLLASIYSN